MLAVVACGDFGGDYGYQGVQLVASGPYEVRSVFWLASEPVVLAARRDPNKAPQMHMISLVSGVSCKAGPLSSYVAAVDERGFRLALTDAGGNLRFYDERCNAADPVVPNAGHLRVFVYHGHYQYLVSQNDGTLLVVDPFKGTQSLVARDVTGFEPSSLSIAPDYPLALWIRHSTGIVTLWTLDGQQIGDSFENISSMSLRGGLVSNGHAVELLMTEDDTGVQLYLFTQESDSPSYSQLLDEPDACAAQILGIAVADCADGSCSSEQNVTQLQQGALPWLAMESPCGSGDLLLSAVDGSRRYQVANAAADYQLFPPKPGADPWLFFNAARSGGTSKTYFAEVTGSNQSTLKAKSTGQHFDLGSLGRSSTGDEFTAITAEAHPRYGFWNPSDGFMPLLKDVADLYGQYLLHKFDGTTGTLAVCEEANCLDIAKDVPPGGFVHYTTVARVGSGVSVLAYLTDYDADNQIGTLTAFTPDLRLSRIIDRHVSGFLNVESGPVRGIVYSVDEGKGGRQGIWFAPR